MSQLAIWCKRCDVYSLSKTIPARCGACKSTHVQYLGTYKGVDPALKVRRYGERHQQIIRNSLSKATRATWQFRSR